MVKCSCTSRWFDSFNFCHASSFIHQYVKVFLGWTSRVLSINDCTATKMFKRKLVKLGLHDPHTQPLSPRIPNDRWMKKRFAGPLVVTSGPVTLNHHRNAMECSWNAALLSVQWLQRRLLRHPVLAMLRWTLDKNRSSGHRLLIAGRSGKTCSIWNIRFPYVPILVN